MPNYSYECPACGEKTVENRRIDDRDALRHCGTCFEAALKRLLDAPALQDFIGSHRDEYTKTGPRK